MTKHKVSATESLYIKLGRGGQWEDQCIRDGTLRLGYRETPHNWCASGDWEKVKEERLKAREGRRSAATSDVNQIRKFYDSPNDVLWITFHKHSLWWCHSNQKIKKLLRQINLTAWQPQQVLFDGENIWLISGKDGLLYGLLL